MIHRILPVILPLLLSAAIFAQDKTGNRAETGAGEVDNLPSQSFSTYYFDVEKFSVSLGYDNFGRGELLNVEFGLRNKTDDDRELYIFAIATEEIDRTGPSSFKEIIESGDKTNFLNFVPYPVAAEDANKEYRHMKNVNFRFRTEKNDNSPGMLHKFPRDPKLGVSPHTGKAYELKDTLYVKTSHLSRYRKNYVFFNHVTILIFDAKNLMDEKGALNLKMITNMTLKNNAVRTLAWIQLLISLIILVAVVFAYSTYRTSLRQALALSLDFHNFCIQGR